MKRFRSAVGLGMAIGLLSGCQVYNEDLLGGGCPPTALGCIPAPPENRSEPDGTANLEIAFALTEIDLNQIGDTAEEDTWPTTGLDLDGFDTTVTDPVQACAPARSGVAIPPDGVNGIDNVFGQSFYPQFVRNSVPNFEEQVCCWQRRGRGTLIVRMRDWNGTKDDPRVTASLMYAVDGVDTVTGRGTPNAMQTIPSAYAWDSTTEHGVVFAGTSNPAPGPSWQIDEFLNPPSTGTWWYIDPSSLVGNDLESPKLSDPNAYVVDGVVVMSLKAREPVTLFLGDDVTLDQTEGRGGSLQIGFTDGHAWARLSDDFSRIVSGGLAGRLADTDLLAAASAIGVCLQLQQIRGIVQNYADVMSDPALSDPNTPCDAVSVGVSFRGLRAGAIASNPAGESLCLPSACDMKACAPLGSDHGQCGGPGQSPVCPPLP